MSTNSPTRSTGKPRPANKSGAASSAAKTPEQPASTAVENPPAPLKTVRSSSGIAGVTRPGGVLFRANQGTLTVQVEECSKTEGGSLLPIGIRGTIEFDGEDYKEALALYLPLLSYLSRKVEEKLDAPLRAE